MKKSKHRVWSWGDGTWFAEDGLPVDVQAGHRWEGLLVIKKGKLLEVIGVRGKTPFEALERLKAYRRKTSQPRK